MSEYSVKNENVFKLSEYLESLAGLFRTGEEIYAPINEDDGSYNLTKNIRDYIKAQMINGKSIVKVRFELIELFGAYYCDRCGLSEDIKYLKIYESNGDWIYPCDCRVCRNERVRNHKNRNIENKLFKLKSRVRMGIANAFRTYVSESKKGKKTSSILGMDWDDFYQYLLDNSKFSEITSDIHLDHIIPMSCVRTEEEVYILNHYSNFQLLTKKENLAKNNKYVRLVNLQRVLLHTPYKKEIQNIIKREDFDII